MLAALLGAVLTVSSVDGGLELTDVEDVAALHVGELDTCRNEKAAGVVQLDFTVVDGGVASVSALRDSRPGAAGCLTRALSTWAFPPGPVSFVRYEWAPAKKPGASEPVEIPAPVDELWRRRGDVAACYVKHRKEPADEGPVDADVVLVRSGAVLSATLARVGVRFSETPLGDCVVDAVRQWRFPRLASPSRARLSWQLVRKRTASPPQPDVVVVTEAEPTTPTVADLPIHAALLQQTNALQPCSSGAETLVLMGFERLADGGLLVKPVLSNPADPQVEDCVAARAGTFDLPLKPGEKHQDAWLFQGDGGVVAYQTTHRSDVGGLAKDVIMKVIKKHQNEIKFCYEQRLQQIPTLAGKVAVLFIIGASGEVLSAEAEELEDQRLAPVAECMTRRIRGWKFPEPINGGKVTVTFPWIFKPAGVE